jgi:glutaredoxin-like protein NrdH
MKSFIMVYCFDFFRESPHMPSNSQKIRLFTLSTCSHCHRTKRFFQDRGIRVEFTDVDLLTGAERAMIMDEVRKLNPDCSFPTICIDDIIIIGFNEEKIKKALDLP